MAAEKNVTLAAISCRDTWKEREAEGKEGKEEKREGAWWRHQLRRCHRSLALFKCNFGDA